MPLNTMRRPNRYRSSRRGLSGGRGGAEFGRSPGILPLPAGGGNSGIVDPLAGRSPTAGASPLVNKAPMQTVQTLNAPGAAYYDPRLPATAEIPTAPFPGAVYAGSGNGGATVFWQDPATGQLRVFNGTQEISRPTAVQQPGSPPGPAAPPPVAPPPATTTPPAVTTTPQGASAQPVGGTSPVNVPTGQFGGSTLPPWLQAALAGQVVSLDEGGIIPETVIGYGTQTGMMYHIAGRGPERVLPAESSGVSPAPLTQPGY